MTYFPKVNEDDRALLLELYQSGATIPAIAAAMHITTFAARSRLDRLIKRGDAEIRYRRWSEDEEHMLRELWGLPYQVIAQKMRRSVFSIASKSRDMGLDPLDEGADMRPAEKDRAAAIRLEALLRQHHPERETPRS